MAERLLQRSVSSALGLGEDLKTIRSQNYALLSQVVELKFRNLSIVCSLSGILILCEINQDTHHTKIMVDRGQSVTIQLGRQSFLHVVKNHEAMSGLVETSTVVN